jgi:hypothetical protein
MLVLCTCSTVFWPVWPTPVRPFATAQSVCSASVVGGEGEAIVGCTAVTRNAVATSCNCECGTGANGELEQMSANILINRATDGTVSTCGSGTGRVCNACQCVCTDATDGTPGEDVVRACTHCI